MNKIIAEETTVTTSRRIMNSDLNEHGTLFGGRLLEIVDAEPSVIASRLTHKTVVTASLDHINFFHPFHLGDALIMTAYVTGIGHRSIEVFVKVVGEHLQTGERFLGYTGFNTYVVSDHDFAFPETVIEGRSKEAQSIIAGYQARQAKRKEERATDKEWLPNVEL